MNSTNEGVFETAFQPGTPVRASVADGGRIRIDVGRDDAYLDPDVASRLGVWLIRHGVPGMTLSPTSQADLDAAASRRGITVPGHTVDIATYAGYSGAGTRFRLTCTCGMTQGGPGGAELAEQLRDIHLSPESDDDTGHSPVSAPADVDTTGLREFRVTFGPLHEGVLLAPPVGQLDETMAVSGSRYATPEGWLTVWALDEGHARVHVLRRIGRRWADIYDVADGGFDESFYPVGELARWVYRDSFYPADFIGPYL